MKTSPNKSSAAVKEIHVIGYNEIHFMVTNSHLEEVESYSSSIVVYK